MLINKLSQRTKILCLRSNYLWKSYSKQVYHQETYFAPHKEKKPHKEPFLKDLLIGKVNPSLFTFPEVQCSERYKQFTKWLEPIENYMSSCVDTNKKLDEKEILDNLRELEVFRAHIEENYGLNLLQTELLKLIEIINTLPWLGTYLIKNHILPIEIISKYGSMSQKQEFYPKIMNGEIVPTICIYEGKSGTNINQIKTHAIQNEKDSWLLNGEKTFVANGINSNLFLVFAKITPEPTSFSLFLVERNHESTTCIEVHEPIGKHQLPICTISFKNAVVPSKNIIGEPGDALKILMELLTPGNLNIAAVAINILKNFTTNLTADILKLKQFDRDLHQFDVVKKTMGEIMFTLYTMESMAYFTSGIIDQYQNQDVEIEKMITVKYCVHNCLKCIQTGLQLIGNQAYLNNTPYVQLFHNALALTTLHMNNMDINTYVAASSLKHFGQLLHRDIYEKRNYLNFAMKIMINSLISDYDKRIHIANYFHPSIKIGANSLEGAIHIFRQSVKKLLTSYGSEVMQKYTELERITEMMTEIYATLVNLSRVSRSYSIGLRNADSEKNLVATMAYNSCRKVKAIAHEIEEGSYDNGDYFYQVISEESYNKHRYSIEHPLSRTF